jgi:hypothetical protein
MKFHLLCLLLILHISAFAQQHIGVTFSPNPLVARKYVNEKLVIPIEITFEKSVGTAAFSTALSVPIQVTLVQTGILPSLDFTAGEFNQIALENLSTNVQFDTFPSKKIVKVYVIFPAGLSISTNKALNIAVSINGVLASVKQLSIEPANEVVYSLTAYDTNPSVKLDNVTKVESSNNVLTIAGYEGGGFTKRNVLLERNQVFAVIQSNYISWGKGYWNSIPFSLITVPFKIRPRNKTTLTKTNPSTDTAYRATAMSGITNLGINLDLVKRTTDRYFSNGKKSTHKWALGVFVTPGVEELGAAQVKDTSLVGDGKSKQFVVSGGFSISYAYNGITFLLVPAALDWAPSALGKQWIYNKKFWWGFGIGVSPTILGQVFNSK